MTEREILDGCRARDPGAAVLLVARYQGLLARIVGRLVCRQSVAEEIVQEAFLRAFRDIEEIDPASGVGRWLTSVALNLARDHLDRASTGEVARWPSEASTELFPGATLDPEASALAEERRHRLELAIGALPPRFREVVVLHYVEGIPFFEIAALLGERVSALKMRALRARAQLRKLLPEWAP